MKTVILLQENYEDFCNYFKEHPSFKIVGATNSGSEGLALIESLKPDALIMDIILKELDGLSVLERLKTTSPDTKALVYSAFDSDEVIRSACLKGAQLYLVKPLPLELIANRLSTLFKKEGRVLENFAPAELRISNVFLSAGIPPHVKGYGFLRSGVRLAIQDPAILSNVTKQLYPMIAKEFETTPSKVERAIRHAIEVAWNRGRIETLNSTFGVAFYQNGDKPTNSEFIALVADRIIQEIHLGKIQNK